MISLKEELRKCLKSKLQLMKAKELDVVSLKDGRIGTILETYDKENAYLLEINGTNTKSNRC